jgi:hypothetical protein
MPGPSWCAVASDGGLSAGKLAAKVTQTQAYHYPPMGSGG